MLIEAEGKLIIAFWGKNCKNNLEVDENLDIPNLPLKWKSNTNLIAQLLLNDQEIINLIVQVLVGMIHHCFLIKHTAFI
jgi:hypothetical protein